MTSRLKTPLWDFALDLYGRPGVSHACLTLQDEAGLDVIHLIVVAYADHIGKPLDAEDIATSREAMKDWRAGAVLPLRTARRFLKAPLPALDAEKEALREAVKAAELKAEQLQLAMAHGWLTTRVEKRGLPLPEALQHLLAPSQDQAVGAEAIQQALSTITAAVRTIDQA
ncbi:MULTISPECIES: TIGR02444 family protein [unclassified Chelatococcus]|uniref:TIGR02444 family protein n=1 Tax=unclassified Chelatococcus TaxID=2638111 RepID=UPI001BCAE045|nr:MULTISPECIES: TIGR02444 family protein [unclassified Chelatococcus]MBS7700843.1 TIGR02444 family protein [Chelatococcus sp. YT9]MBX3555376.1 TIGR02444 family protein [Chelatococcus sp.]